MTACSEQIFIFSGKFGLFAYAYFINRLTQCTWPNPQRSGLGLLVRKPLSWEHNSMY